MDADFTVTTRLVTDGPALTRGPHFEGPARVLDIPSRRFYATTGFPLKAVGEVPPDMRYLGASERIAGCATCRRTSRWPRGTRCSP